MTILVTGAYGFLGKFVCKKLKEEGYTDIIQLGGSKNSLSLDLTKSDNVKHIFKTYEPDSILHLAARVGGIGANKKSPGRFFYDNMAMGLNLVEQARKQKCDKFVLIGTVCSYPKFTPVPFKEEDIWDGYPEETNAPYGIAKKALMEMLQAYRKEYGLNGIALIPVNMYGPGDNFNPESSHVIPALILKIQEAINNKDSSVVAWGTGEASREFLYVEDCAEAIVQGLKLYNSPEPLNIGTNSEIKIKDLIEMLCDIMGYDGKIIFDDSKPDGQPRRCLNVERAFSNLNWKAKTTLEVGLQKTINWFRTN